MSAARVPFYVHSVRAINATSFIPSFVRSFVRSLNIIVRACALRRRAGGGKSESKREREREQKRAMGKEEGKKILPERSV